MQYHYNTLNYNYMNCIRRLFFSAFFLMLYGMFFPPHLFFCSLCILRFKVAIPTKNVAPTWRNLLF